MLIPQVVEVQLNFLIAKLIVVKDKDKYGVLKIDRNINSKNMFGSNDSISIKIIKSNIHVDSIFKFYFCIVISLKFIWNTKEIFFMNLASFITYLLYPN